MRWAALCGTAAAVGSWPSEAAADPIEFVEQRNNFMVFEDPDGALENANWFERDPFLANYADVEAGFLAAHPDDSQFLVIYTTWSLPNGIGAFFQSVANDVQGIGFEHIAPEDAVIPEPYFDDTPASQIQGFLHMNRWSQYAGGDRGGVDDRLISLIFGQELGHAWGSFVYYQETNADPWETGLLGRANAHWSFYMNAGPSPMQGHEWIDNGDGTFTALPADLFVYNDLDLYLMGLLPADEVEPWFVLENPTNCVDSQLRGGDCAPVEGHVFGADSYTVTADRRDVTIDMVQLVEGPRVPAWPEAPDSFDVSFLFVKRPGEELTQLELDLLETVVERSIELFEVQTGGLGHVVNRTVGEAPPGGDTGDGPGATSGVDDTGSDSASGGAASVTASATDGGDGAVTAAGSGPGGADAATGDTDGENAADGADGSGCSCSARPGPSPAVAWWGLFALVGRRRRSTSRRPSGL